MKSVSFGLNVKHAHRLTVNLVEVDLSATSPGASGVRPRSAGGDGDGSVDPNSSAANLRDLDGGGGEERGASVSQSGLAGGTGGGGEGATDDINAKRAFKAKFQEGISLFNKKPKKGRWFNRFNL